MPDNDGEASASTTVQLAARRKELVTIRKNTKTKITKLKNYLIESGPYASADYIDKHNNKILQEMLLIPEITRELRTLEPGVEHDEIQEDMEDDIEQIRVLIQKFKEPWRAQNPNQDREPRDFRSPSIGIHSQCSSDRLKLLPKVEAKTFDGKLENWRSYRDWFLQTVDRCEGLTDSQRLDYLTRTLKGEAADTIKAFPPTDENYKVAWDLLKKTYDIEYALVLHHYDLLMDTPVMKRNTAEEMKKLANHVQSQVSALKALGQKVEGWNTPISHLILRKLDKETGREWNRKMQNTVVPNYEDLLNFLREESTRLVSVNGHLASAKPQNSSDHGNQKNHKKNAQRTQTLLTNVSGQRCPHCKGQHELTTCEQFLALTPLDRVQTARKTGICLKCFQTGHKTRVCKETPCATCRKGHNTILHLSEEETKIMRESNPRKTIALVATLPSRDFVVTAVVKILDNQGKPVQCRAILDTAAGTNFMTESLANKLKLPRSKLAMKIEGLNDAQTAANSLVKTKILSRTTGFQRSLDFLTVDQIGKSFPTEPIDRNALQIPKNIALADPLFDQPAPVDVLISVGTTLSTFCQGQIQLNDPKDPDLILQKTQLGWILGGNPLGNNCYKKLRSPVSCNLVADTTNFDLKKFWEMEEVNSVRHLSKEEELCEAHFKANVTRDDTGRYTVALPFNDKKDEICKTRNLAESRLRGLMKKLSRDPDLEKQYRTVMQEYIDLGHMTEVEISDVNEGYYQPHHAVIKPTSLTTKVRAVFNASAKLGPGTTSLNDALMNGPQVQRPLINILIEFLFFEIAMSADIEKMFRQILVAKEDRKYQRILWFNEGKQPTVFELNTVTFGETSSPYLATATINQLAEDESQEFPEAAKVIKENCYVDNFLIGATTLEEALKLRDDVITVMNRGGFNLREWASNEPLLLEGLPAGSVNLQIQTDKDATIKTLGLHWDSQHDAIVYTVKPIPNSKNVTKRVILSELAKIFDPLGWLGPIILTGKMLMQKLWLEKLDWDDPVPLSISTEWKNYVTELNCLDGITFERKVIISNVKDTELHGFCDASEKAYGACIYLKTIDGNGKSQVRLICAKSRVAPIKTISLPRLELCSALLLVDLYEMAKRSIKHNISRAIFWSDSMVALHWINTSPHKLQVFVANRVSRIQEKSADIEWRHVRTEFNPADHISRGLMPTEFVENTQWKYGPSWLNENESIWPVSELAIPIELPEMKKTVCLLSAPPSKNELLERYSSIGKLRRIIAYCCRFKNKGKGLLTVQELNAANDKIIKLVQAETFSKEIKELERGQPSTLNNRLKSLTPILDENGLIRVGGRLRNAQIPYAQKHPLLLPKNHFVTKLLIRNEHLTNLHSGTQTTLYSLRRKYWLIDGRNQVRQIINRCVTCTRMNPQTNDHIMGDLPRVRVTVARPFVNVGVDYCGPFYLKEKKHRNRTKVKVWVAVFVCMSIKAVHLEVVSDLTTEAFIAALKRFIGRRGKPTNIYSDNGTNFIGANNEIKELYSLLRSEKHNNEIHGELKEQGIQWHFNPPHAPHFGGLWEAGVKSFKHHLKRISDELLTFEEFNTLVIEIEAILNSRPLTPISTDPNDLSALTPGHFLIGDAMTGLPEPKWESTPSNRLSQWELIQKKRQEFWGRWYKEYLNEQLARSKWTTGTHQVKEGSIVLIKEDNLPPRQWVLGKVIQVYPGSDGIVRTVKVKTSKGEFDRCVRKLAPLLCEK